MSQTTSDRGGGALSLSLVQTPILEGDVIGGQTEVTAPTWEIKGQDVEGDLRRGVGVLVRVQTRLCFSKGQLNNCKRKVLFVLYFFFFLNSHGH